MCAVGLVASLTVERLGRTQLLWLTKPTASAGFLMAALAADALATPYGQAVFVALVLSWLGDVLLVPRGKGPLFLPGVIAFLLGHVAFVVAFAVRGIAWSSAAIAAICLVPVVIAVWRWLGRKVRGPLRPAVIGYMVVITAMVAAAIGTHVVSPDWRIVVAAIMFYLSDLFVARQRFVTRAWTNRVVGLPLYYAAQCVFAATVTIWAGHAL